MSIHTLVILGLFGLAAYTAVRLLIVWAERAPFEEDL